MDQQDSGRSRNQADNKNHHHITRVYTLLHPIVEHTTVPYYLSMQTSVSVAENTMVWNNIGTTSPLLVNLKKRYYMLKVLALAENKHRQKKTTCPDAWINLHATRDIEKRKTRHVHHNCKHTKLAATDVCEISTPLKD